MNKGLYLTVFLQFKMKIAVTGASGHVGANLCRMLIDRGHEVKALIHNSTKGIEDLGLEFVPVKLTVKLISENSVPAVK